MRYNQALCKVSWSSLGKSVLRDEIGILLIILQILLKAILRRLCYVDITLKLDTDVPCGKCDHVDNFFFVVSSLSRSARAAPAPCRGRLPLLPTLIILIVDMSQPRQQQQHQLYPAPTSAPGEYQRCCCNSFRQQQQQRGRHRP